MQTFLTYLSLALLSIIAVGQGLSGQTVILYSNDFSEPLTPPESECSPDIVFTPVNDLWQGTGEGTGGGGAWAQTFTVETMMINGPDNIYTDPSGIGGDYCIAMVNTFEDDRTALTLDKDSFPFVNLTMDISAADVPTCGGPFGVFQPTFLITAYDTPSGVFNFSGPGIILDQATMTGTQPGITPYTLNWANVGTGLDVSNSTGSTVTIVMDLTSSGYSVFDNIEISASATALSLQENDSEQLVFLYPNPANDRIQLDLSTSTYSWSIHAMDGSEVIRGTSNTSGNIDVKALDAGTYLIQITGNEGVRFGRFVKE